MKMFVLLHSPLILLLLETASATADTYIAAYGENIVADLSLEALPKFLLRILLFVSSSSFVQTLRRRYIVSNMSLNSHCNVYVDFMLQNVNWF